MKTWKRWTALAAAVAFLRPGALALTGETWREELDFYAAETPTVVTASLRSQKLDEVPGTMTVVTDKDIRALGLQTLLQVMNLIPGFELTQESFGPLNIVVRGYRFSTGHLKLMIDGHPVNAADHKEVDAWLDMPLDDVKQVEVNGRLRGGRQRHHPVGEGRHGRPHRRRPRALGDHRLSGERSGDALAV